MGEDGKKMGRPLQGETQKITRSIMVDPVLWEKAMARADERGESLSSVIGRSLTRYAAKGTAAEKIPDGE